MKLKIHDVAFGGSGVARDQGKVVFVPFTIAGEEVTARPGKAKKNFVQGSLLSIESPSPHRVLPRCPYFQRCGGCCYQHIAYPHQLEIKQAQVEQTLRRIGRMESVPMQPIIPSPDPYNYRSRVRVHSAEGVIGFYAFGSHELVDIDSCPIASDKVNEALRHLRNIRAGDGDYTLREPGRAEFFEQTNDKVAAEMLALIHRLVRDDQKLLIDAYCGAGFFAKHLRDRFEQVIGIESYPPAIERATSDAAPNETYVCGDVAENIGYMLAEADLARTTLILDPPAAGIAPRVVDLICGSPPLALLYVSCDVATMARDIASLRGAYTLQSVTALDMFPQTAEIEVVASLARL